MSMKKTSPYRDVYRHPLCSVMMRKKFMIYALINLLGLCGLIWFHHPNESPYLWITLTWISTLLLVQQINRVRQAKKEPSRDASGNALRSNMSHLAWSLSSLQDSSAAMLSMGFATAIPNMGFVLDSSNHARLVNLIVLIIIIMMSTSQITQSSETIREMALTLDSATFLHERDE